MSIKRLQELAGIRSARPNLEEARKMSKKAAEKMFDQLYKKHASGVQFDIFDLSKVSKMVTSAILAGEDGEEAMKAAIKKYRKN